MPHWSLQPGGISHHRKQPIKNVSGSHGSLLPGFILPVLSWPSTKPPHRHHIFQESCSARLNLFISPTSAQGVSHFTTDHGKNPCTGMYSTNFSWLPPWLHVVLPPFYLLQNKRALQKQQSIPTLSRFIHRSSDWHTLGQVQSQNCSWRAFSQSYQKDHVKLPPRAETTANKGSTETVPNPKPQH